MTTLPVQMVDRWQTRSEPGPSQGTVYWHMLMKDHPRVMDLAPRRAAPVKPIQDRCVGSLYGLRGDCQPSAATSVMRCRIEPYLDCRRSAVLRHGAARHRAKPWEAHPSRARLLTRMPLQIRSAHSLHRRFSRSAFLASNSPSRSRCLNGAWRRRLRDLAQ